MKKRFLLFISLLLLAFSCAQPGTGDTGAQGGGDTSNLSGVAELSDLKLSDNLRLNQHFSPGHYRYRLTVANRQTELTVTPVLADKKASFTITNNDVTVSNTIPLAVGMNSVKIEVTAENGKATRIYILFITRDGKSNADLTGIDGITLNETFESHILNYTAYVDLSVESVTITPELSDPNSSCTVNGTADSAAIALNVGDNYVNIRVIAEDGRTNKYYSLVITKWDGSDATLKGLGINGVSLNEQFSMSIYLYTANVDENVQSMQLYIAPSNKYASYLLKMRDVEVTNPVSLEYGNNPIDIVVTSQDGTKSLTYRVDIIRTMVLDDFETGDLSRNPWRFNNKGKLSVKKSPVGSKAAEISTTGYPDQSFSELRLALTVKEATDLEFNYYYKNSGFAGYKFQFFIDNLNKITKNYTTGGTVSYKLKPGLHVLKWQLRYGSNDYLYLDDIKVIGGKVEMAYMPPYEVTVLPNYTSSTISLEWPPVSEAEFYNVYRASTADGVYEKINKENVITGSYTDSNLISKTEYFYKVTAVVKGVESFKSDYVRCTTRIPPTVPTEFKVTDVTENSVTISWLHDGAVGFYYRVYRADSLNGSYKLHVKTGSGYPITYKDTQLDSGTTYYYKVSAHNRYEESELTAPVEAVTRIGAPQNITYQSTTDKITLQWSPAKSATSYEIYRSLTAEGSYTLISPANYSSTTFVDQSLQPQNTYFYKLVSINSNERSSMSPHVKAFTKLPTPANLKVTGLRLNGVSLSWDKVQGATEYEIFRAASPNGPYEKLYGTTSFSYYHDKWLETNKTYYYKVKALNSTGFYSEESPPLEGTTSANSSIGTPTGLTIVTSYSDSFKIKWNGVYGAKGYVLYYSVGNPEGPYKVHDLFTSVTHTIYGKGYSIGSGKTYYYKVSAFDANGEGAQSSRTFGRTSGAPLAPTGVRIQSATTSQITISWSGSYGADQYQILRSTSPNGSYSNVGFTSGPGTTYVHSGSFSAGTTYYYKVSAVRGYDFSAYSSYAVATVSQ